MTQSCNHSSLCFHKFMRYEDNLLHSKENAVQAPIPIDPTHVITQATDRSILEQCELQLIEITREQIKYDSETKCYYADVSNVYKKKDIILIHADNGVSSVIFDYQFMSSNTLRFYFKTKLRSFVYLLIKEK